MNRRYSDWSPRQCRDGLVHRVSLTALHGRDEPKRWLRMCDPNDDFVAVMTLPLTNDAVNCVVCVVKDSEAPHEPR